MTRDATVLLEALRAAEGPLSTAELVSRAYPDAPSWARRTLISSSWARLNKLRDAGRVDCEVVLSGGQRLAYWSVHEGESQ